MEILNQVHNNNLIKWAKNRPEVLVLSGDLTGSTEIDLFKKTYPDRFISMGLGEQNMLSFAGGLAREGYIPFLHTFAVFLYRRPYDQLAMSVCYPNLKVRIFGFLPGLMTPGGVTHQAIEDIATLRGLPNLTILEVGDATEVESVLDATETINGPVYIRMLRGEIPRLFDKSEPFKVDKVRVINDGEDITLFSSGSSTEEAMRAIEIIESKGISVRHVHVSTLKPFNDSEILNSINKAKYGIITMENHNIIGGLGTCVSEVMAQNGCSKKLYRIGIKDRYGFGSSFNYLKKKYEIDARALINKIEEIMNVNLNISDNEIKEVRIQTIKSIPSDQLEAL
ncbi:transketolase family protein [Oceanivirga salmonicida]|uniref:transketolase family protein n=1 Tax=Oceanivirga salmonicida TaxID=1769291 RepID=UPI00082EFA0E|nr:transketolase C-terminal domain-containing protein [Oceanivirga salmonicida]